MSSTPSIEAAIERARAKWPGIGLVATEVESHVRARVGGDLEGACLEDLCLAWAALQGDRVALEALEALLAQVPSWIRKDASSPLVDELVQTLRVQLLVGDNPLLAQFRGRGALHAWLRISARRLAWKQDAPRGEAAASGAEPSVGSRAARMDPERALAGAAATPAVLAAVRAGFDALDRRQRTLLRLRYAQGLTDEAIGRMYRVHQSTATRWLAAAHETVRRSVRKHLEAELRVGGAELESVLHAAESQLDISLSTLLASGTAPP